MGCQTEELAPKEDSISLRAKAWYGENHNLLLNSNPSFYGYPDWENFIEVGDEIYFPLISELNGRKQEKDINKADMVFAKSYLVLENIEGIGFEESLKVFVSQDNSSFEDESYASGLSYLHYDSNNNLIEYVLTEEGISNEISNPTITGASISAKCKTYHVIRTDTYTDGSVEVTLLFSYQACDGGGGSSGGSGSGSDGGGNTSDLPLADEEPPSCKSFDFKKTGSNWQESNVRGVYFNVWLTYTTPPYLEYRYTVKLDQPVNFGAPLKDRRGVELPAGTLASASANALHTSMKETVDAFDGQQVNTSVIESYFKERIRINYPLHIIGGRANTNSTSSLPATQYEATTRSDFGGCHN